MFEKPLTIVHCAFLNNALVTNIFCYCPIVPYIFTTKEYKFIYVF